MKSRALSILVIVAFLCCGITQAQIPRKLNYQGYLTTPTGAPVNTPQTLIARIYDVSSGGTHLFTETHTTVTVSNGIFNILLGGVDTNVNPLNLSFSTQYYLGITVGTDAEMSPRQPLAASPYALRAVTAESLAPGGNIVLTDPSSATAGNIMKGSSRFIHNPGFANTFIGVDSGNFTVTGSSNTVTGAFALGNVTSGQSNTASGVFALNGNTSGSYNIALGIGAGGSLTSGDFNINIGNAGVAGEAATTRIGTSQTRAFMAGIRGVTPAVNDALPVVIDSNGQLGTGVSVSSTLAGDVTGPQSATVVALVGGVTAANVATGANLANAATSGNTFGALVRRDASGNFSAGTISTTGGLNLSATNGAGTQGVINQAGNRLLHSFGSANIFAGSNAGNFSMTGGNNTGVGNSALAASTSGGQNTATGSLALAANTGGGQNTASGYSAMQANTAGGNNAAFGSGALQTITGGNFNTAIGGAALAGVAGNSSNNIGIGFGAGSNLTTGSGNIDIGNAGVAGESNIIRIGTSQTDTYLTGVVRGNGAGLTGVSASIADGSITSAKLAASGCATGQILKFSGSAWACAADDTGVPAGGAVGQVLVGTGSSPAWSNSPVISGNVSVGSASAAAARLDVSGSGWFRADANGFSASAAQGVRVFYDTFSGTGSVFAYDYAATSPLNLTLQSPGGNVGIGTAVPSSKLTVSGRIESISGGIKFPDGSIQLSAASSNAGTFNVAAPQPNILTTVDAVGDVGQFTAMTVAPDGLPVISYFDASNGRLKVAKCGNAACSSGNTLTAVDATALIGRYTSIAISADGLPVISYVDQTNGTVKVAKCGNAACSSANTLTTVGSMGGVSWYTAIAIGADGLPVIAYRDSSVGFLKLTHCGNAACSAGNSTATVDASAQVGQHVSIAVGVDGLPVIAYYDNTNSYLKVAHCGDAACLLSATLATVDIAGVVGEYPSIAIGADGLPVISYRDATANDLKVAHCGNVNCSVGNTLTAVDTVGVVGLYTSITIGADGLPMISHYDGSNGDLRVARCGNAACSSGNALITVDSVGNLGQYSSISIGADGLPVISYYDASNGDLKAAKCGSAFCAPYFRRR